MTKKKQKGNRFLNAIKQLKLINFLGLTVAGCINAVGVTLFLAPLKLIDSGISGLSMVLGSCTTLQLSLYLLIFNLPIYLFGIKKKGFVFTVYSIYAIAIYSLMAWVIQNAIPSLDLSTSPVVRDDTLLGAIFGGLISGIGSGLTMRFGGALDGVELLAVVFAHYIGITVGTFIMAFNVVLYISAAFVYSSWVVPLYSMIAYAVGLKAVDFIVTGLDKAKAAIIITSKGEKVSKTISQQLGHGITVLDGHGYYSREKKIVLYCVVNRFQIARLKNVVRTADPNAFVTISDVADTLGTSVMSASQLFTNRKKQRKDNRKNTKSITEIPLTEETKPYEDPRLEVADKETKQVVIADNREEDVPTEALTLNTKEEAPSEI